MEEEKQKRIWDKGLDLEQVQKYLESKFLYATRTKQRLWIIIALTQLRNGSRAGEAVWAVVKWAETGHDELVVPLEKRKDAERTFYMPKILTKELREKYRQFFQEHGISTNNPLSIQKLTACYKTGLVKQHKINSHSLRYAFVTYMLKKGVPAALVSKMVGHASIQHLIKYTQQKEANETLKNSINF